MQGYVDINGSGNSLANATIELRNSADEVIATTTANGDGKWIARCVALPVGYNSIHATAMRQNGLPQDAGTVAIDVYEPVECEMYAADDDEGGEISGLQEIDHPEYQSLVAWVALNGYAYLDTDRAERALLEVGRDIDEFTADVAAYAAKSEMDLESRETAFSSSS